MNCILKSFVLAFMAVAALSTGSTVSAEESKHYHSLPTVKGVNTNPTPLRGWRHLEDLSPGSTAPVEESNSLRGSAINYPAEESKHYHSVPTVKGVKTAPTPLRGWRHLENKSTAAAEESNSLRGFTINYPAEESKHYHSVPTVKGVKTAPTPLRGWCHLEHEVLDDVTITVPPGDMSF